MLFNILGSLLVGWIVSLLGFRDDLISITHIQDEYYYGIWVIVGIVVGLIAMARGE